MCVPLDFNIVTMNVDYTSGTIFAYGVTSSGKTHTMHVRVLHLDTFCSSACYIKESIFGISSYNVV
jgi:chromosomal replication initiation ATPase DnaA